MDGIHAGPDTSAVAGSLKDATIAIFGTLVTVVLGLSGAIASWVRAQIETLHERVSSVKDAVADHDVRISVAESEIRRLPRMERKLDALLTRHGVAIPVEDD